MCCATYSELVPPFVPEIASATDRSAFEMAEESDSDDDDVVPFEGEDDVFEAF